MDVKGIIERYSSLKASRDGYWLSVWREVRQYVMPTYSDFLTEGGARGQNIYDTTAIEARQRLASGMYNWMAPPDKRWFDLVPQDEELSKDEEVKDYFGEVTKEIAFAMANSNWASVLIQALNNLACGLDGIVYCEEGDGTLLNFRSFPVETVCYAADWRGEIDTVYREFEMTARQMAQEFREGIPDTVKREADGDKTKEKKHRILHAVFPRKERQKGCLDKKNMPFCDVYIDLETKVVLEEGGYEENPFAVCRFEKSDNEVYGRGPGLNMLPTIKMANRMQQAYILGREHQADPSWLIPDGSLVEKDFDKDPGAVIPYKPDINGQKPEVLQNVANLNTLFQDIKEVDDEIKRGFFWDIFDPLGDLKQITATEAEIRNQGKMIPFAPIAGNLHSELFRVVIHRVYGILQRKGMLPEPPAALAAKPDYKVEFVSKIALSIRNLESAAWLQTEATVANLAAAKPELLDNFDLDLVVRDIASANGANPKWLVPAKDRDAKRQAAAEAAQAQMAAQEMLEGAGALGQNLGKKPEDGSPLAAVMNL